LKTQTKITLHRKTLFFPEQKLKDDGTSLLMEALALIRKERQVGTLTAQIGTGGTIANLSFTKENRIPSDSEGIVFQQAEED
jgi:hypothetical protein